MTFPALASRAVLTRPLLSSYALCLVVFIATQSLSTVLPFHLTDVGGTKTQVGLLFSVTTIVSMALRPVVGGWIDRVGVRRALVSGIAILGAVSLALHVPRDPRTVLAVVAFIGLANALINTANSVVTARAVDPAHRGEALSLYYLASSVGIAVASPAALAILPWAGAGVVFVGVTALAVLMLGFALSLPGALMSVVSGAPPRLRLFSPHAVGVGGALALTAIGYTSIYAFLPLYVTSRGYGGTMVWFFTTYAVCVIVSRGLFGSLSDRVGRMRVALPATLLTAAGYFMLAIPLSSTGLIGAAVLLGSGGGVLYPTLVARVLDRTPAVESGVALGSVKSAWDLGIVVGSALIGIVVDRRSFSAGFAVAGAAAALGALTLVLVERRQRDATMDSAAPRLAAEPHPPAPPRPGSVRRVC